MVEDEFGEEARLSTDQSRVNLLVRSGVSLQICEMIHKKDVPPLAAQLQAQRTRPKRGMAQPPRD